MTVHKISKEPWVSDIDPTKEFDTRTEALNHELEFILNVALTESVSHAESWDIEALISYLETHWSSITTCMSIRGSQISCRICNGDPASHPSGCICDDGSDNGMYEGLQRYILTLEKRLKIDLLIPALALSGTQIDMIRKLLHG